MPRIHEHRQTGKLAVQVDVAVENIGEGLPQETIKAIWEKASNLIRTPNAISGVPSGTPKDHYVLSRSGGQPHFVAGKSSAIYMHDFLAYVAHVSNKKGHLNLFHLSKHGMPPGAGKKRRAAPS